MTDNEFILQDRLGVIRDTIHKYGEENFYISFSGGKDSTVVHHLVDMALPNNKIPRVFSNTGIEFKAIVDFVKSLNDPRLVIIHPKKKVRETLEKVGYPFKSKLYSQNYAVYRRNKDAIHREIEKIETNPKLKEDYEYIHNLPKGVKAVIKFIYNLREREREIGESTFIGTFPNILRYQWDLDMNISDKCCLEFKEKPLEKWEKENKKPYKILGLMREEGGRRAFTNCVVFRGNRLHSFQPLAKVTKDWEEWFIDQYNIQLCELYYEPYNFERTGCVGCPYSIRIQEELETLERVLPSARRQAEYLWQPVYEEYRRIGYRLKREEQTKLF